MNPYEAPQTPPKGDDSNELLKLFDADPRLTLRQLVLFNSCVIAFVVVVAVAYAIGGPLVGNIIFLVGFIPVARVIWSIANDGRRE